MERIDLKIKEPTPEEKERIDEVVKPLSYVSAAINENTKKIRELTTGLKERIDEVVKPFSYVSAAISENFNEHIKPFSDELLKKLEESVNQFMYEYGEEYETIQRCYGAYFKKEGIVIPASANDFLMWLCVKYPDEPLWNMVAKAKDPHNYKLFHEYQVRRLNNSGWDLNSEFEFWQKGGEYKPDEGSFYEIERTLVERIFDFCQNEVKKPIFKIDKTEFLKRFERANFSGDICTRRNKTKIRTIVYKVSLLGAMNDNWYTDAVESLGITKSQCSGFYYEQSFGNGLETIIKEYQNMKLKLNELTSELDKSINRKIKQSNPK